MKIIGIDPGPRKGLHIYDEEGDDHIPLEKSREYIERLQKMKNVLICWDAPLTGPPANVVGKYEATNSNYTKRPIESFFSREETSYKTPKGISVMGYSGCPHWTISRALLGLPRVGPFDLPIEKLIFQPVSSNTSTTPGRHIVEVHPAVAIWRWCLTRGWKEDDKWEYKKDKKVMQKMWETLMGDKVFRETLPKNAPEDPKNDDEFDARVAYVLGCLWLKRNGDVSLFGDENRGSFLLPGNLDELTSKFDEFFEPKIFKR